jgi:predicted aspartyl protease
MRGPWIALVILMAGCASSVPESPPPTVEVPIQIIENVVLVAASINGGPAALLIVDTGASATILTPRLAQRLGIVVPDDAPRRKLHVVGGQALDVPFVKNVSIKVGSATMSDQEIGVYEINPSVPILDGLLGGDFLQRYRVTLDRAARQMKLEPLRR